MEVKMTGLSKLVLGSIAALVMTASAASAAVVCNDEGDCWRVHGRPSYARELRLQIYPDSWRWSRSEHYRWREPGRRHGYWRGGTWVEIR
jgi:hypothetical protein